MAVVLLVAAVAIAGGAVAVAMGLGGAMAPTIADVPPLRAGPLTGADVAAVRPQTALWGYDMQVTDEVLNQAARAIADRDMEIARLRQRLALVEPAGAADLPRFEPAGPGEAGLAATIPDSPALYPPAGPPVQGTAAAVGSPASQGWPRPSALRRGLGGSASAQPWAVWDSPAGRSAPPAGRSAPPAGRSAPPAGRSAPPADPARWGQPGRPSGPDGPDSPGGSDGPGEPDRPGGPGELGGQGGGP